MSGKTNKEKELVKQRRALMADLKAERERKNASKEDRKLCRKNLAEDRRQVLEYSGSVRQSVIDTYKTIKSGDVDAINELADSYIEDATKVAEALRSFASHTEELEELI